MLSFFTGFLLRADLWHKKESPLAVHAIHRCIYLSVGRAKGHNWFGYYTIYVTINYESHDKDETSVTASSEKTHRNCYDKWRYSRVFPHPPHNSYHHNNDDDHCQQSTNNNADHLTRAQAPWNTNNIGCFFFFSGNMAASTIDSPCVPLWGDQVLPSQIGQMDKN